MMMLMLTITKQHLLFNLLIVMDSCMYIELIGVSFPATLFTNSTLAIISGFGEILDCRATSVAE